jgi:CsoR family transcriptional regulator, copper-sensing transcriptional repressor
MSSAQSEKDKADLILRLKRAEGQLRGIQNMIETDVECEKIAQQMSACRKALDRAFHRMIACMIQQQLASAKGVDAATQGRLQHMTELLSKFA